MKAQQKKLSGCASNSLAHDNLGHFEEARHWNIQAKFYNEKFPLVHESGKRMVALPHLCFSLFFWPFFIHPESRPDLWGNHSLHHPFLTWDNALIMMIITLLFTHNSILQLDTRRKI